MSPFSESRGREIEFLIVSIRGNSSFWSNSLEFAVDNKLSKTNCEIDSFQLESIFNLFKSLVFLIRKFNYAC